MFSYSLFLHGSTDILVREFRTTNAVCATEELLLSKSRLAYYLYRLRCLAVIRAQRQEV